MRAIGYILCTVLTLSLVLPALGQSSASTFFTGVNPRNIVSVPFDQSKVLQGMNVNKAFRTPSQSKPFSFSSILPKVQLGSWPPIVPNTPVLNKKSNPYQPNPIYGRNLFSQPSK